MPGMIQRRDFVLAGLATPLLTAPGLAAQRKSLGDPLRVGVDLDLVASGLAGTLQRAFGRDTGIAVKLVTGPAMAMLQALERGEIDAALSNAPQAEEKLVAQGLAHDRRSVARGSCVLVGPAPKGRTPDPAGVSGLKDIAVALQAVRDAAAANPAIKFLSADDGSGAHLTELALWRAAGVAPAAPWYLKAKPGEALAAQVRAQDAYAIVERGSWLAQAGAPTAVLLAGDDRMASEVHVLRSFRINHPAGKIFGEWISGRRGARVVARLRGYQAPAR
jgi:tungstate transport system substrate-binding protein